jgi:multidrug transporter EmrE-like cation transporter
MNSYLSLAAMIVLTTSGMLLLKRGSKSVVYHSGVRTFIRTALNAPVITGVAAATLAPVFYLYALSRLNLSAAYIFTSLNYVCVFFGGWLLLREKVSALQIFGVTCIAAGIIIFHL